jgi:hypothetical protein
MDAHCHGFVGGGKISGKKLRAAVAKAKRTIKLKRAERERAGKPARRSLAERVAASRERVRATVAAGRGGAVRRTGAVARRAERARRAGAATRRTKRARRAA